MNRRTYFKSKQGKIPLPVFFPDATKAVVRALDTSDLESTKTPGILVNTYHLYKDLGADFIKNQGGVGKFMTWKGGLISDSGGFQVGSLIKMNPAMGKVTELGVEFKPNGEKKVLLTPEKSIEFQMKLNTDMIVVLDDFTDPKATYEEAKVSVERTIKWAKRSKDRFEFICKQKSLKEKDRPYILGVVQGGYYQDLRKYCAQELVKIGFDGFGYGGWPLKADKTFDYESAKTIVDNTPTNYFLYGLGVGKPWEIANLFKMGYTIFDCVLPTRDGRHGRMYVFNAKSTAKIDLERSDFYKYYIPNKQKHLNETIPVSTACDCLVCTRYSRSYLAHLFKIGDYTAARLATIHNLRFYSILMERLRHKA